MNVCVVTVTYGNRFHFLKQVIEVALSEGVKKVIVVDNNSAPESKSKLKEYEKELGNKKLTVLYLEENYGSAGGFKKGLEEAYNDKDCEFILCLDDDNLLIKNSIRKAECLVNYLESLNNNYILGFYRIDREENNRIIKEGWIKGYLQNNFMGFNFFNVLKNKFIKRKKKGLINLFPVQPIEVTAMGGAFFHKSILEKIGYPNEDFYLYADDHDFTYRFTKSGGHIFLCSELRIKDLDSTTSSNDGGNIGYFNREFPEFKMYYQIRNHTFFSKNFIENKLLFYSNMIIYLLIYFKKIFKIPKKLFFKRYKLLLKSIKDGLNNHLGKTF